MARKKKINQATITEESDSQADSDKDTVIEFERGLMDGYRQ